MVLSDLIIIAGGGGGGGGAESTQGGDAGALSDPSRGNGAVTKGDIDAAGGGSDGAGGAAGKLDSGLGSGNAGKDFDGSTWGAGGSAASGSPSSSGGAGYGGGGSSAATVYASSAAGGSYANINYVTSEEFTPDSNGGAADTDGGNGSVGLYFYAAPSVTTVAASSVGNSSATIEATVNAQGRNTSALSLKYATDEATVNGGGGTPASISPTEALGASETTVTADLTGLSPGTTYYYRASATNSGGTTHGSTLSFTTTAPDPDPAPAPSGGGSGSAPSAPQPAPASTEPASMPSGPNTSTPTPSQSPLPPANPASSQVISRSVTLVGVETATRAQPRAMLNTPGQRIGKAPRVRATAGEPVKLIVQEGLAASERYEVLIKRRGGSYNELATVETDPAGAVQLPVVQFERTGTFVVAIRSSDSIAYVKLRVRG